MKKQWGFRNRCPSLIRSQGEKIGVVSRNLWNYYNHMMQIYLSLFSIFALYFNVIYASSFKLMQWININIGLWILPAIPIIYDILYCSKKEKTLFWTCQTWSLLISFLLISFFCPNCTWNFLLAVMMWKKTHWLLPRWILFFQTRFTTKDVWRLSCK